MNRHHILSAAVSAACLTMAAGANALALATYVAGADTLEVKISGASAQDIGLEKTLAALCNAGTLNGASQLNQSVYYCSITPNAAVGIIGTTVQFAGVPASVNKLVVYKSSVGGSGNGVAPVANSQTNIQFLNLATIATNANNTSFVSVGTAITSAVLPTYTMQSLVNTTMTANGTPEVGLSDVEPSLLGATAAVIANLTRFEGSHLTFGVPVTKTLRNELQTLQSLPSGSELAAEQPSLSSNQLTAMYNGSITDFANIGLAAGGVNIAFRSATSGTTRTFNAYFGTDGGQCILNARNRRGVTSGDTTGSACSAVPGATGTVIQGAGTDNVVACLTNHEAASRRAIGVLSTETPTSLAGPIRFIKLDGYLPTLVNVANGNYGLWASVSYQYRNATSGNALAGDKLAAAESFRGVLANKNVLDDVNKTIVQTFATAGDVGYLGAPSATNPTTTGFPATTASLAVNLTNNFTKTNGGVQNNCQRGIKF
jgi:hypothetical protein